MLHRLPPELIHNIAFPLVAQTPLGPPAALLPLLLSSRALHATLTAPAFLARICRFKLDTAAVTRRLFTPYHPDLAEHLVHTCLLLHAIKTGDVDHVDVEDYMASALLLMLDNDGKNYAQLKHAGVHAYVDKFVKTRLWDGREENNGWPVHNQVNAAALWLMWLLTERETLLAEPPHEREQLVLQLLPFVVCPHLYPSSEAPPNHFELPLNPIANPTHQHPITLSLPNNSSRNYPHYLFPRSTSQVYFRSRTALSWPLASIPAKLLFVARRELRPIAIPQHIPPGPAGLGGVLTQADYRELNAAKTADLPRGAIWDWERGVGVGVNDPYVPPPAAPAPASLTTPPTTTTTTTTAPKDPIPPGDEESRKWDTTFWRMRLCGDFREPRPKFLPGETFKLGSMSGTWQGRIYIPQGAQYTQLLHQPFYPGVPDERAAEAGYGLLSENSLGLVMQPIFLDVREHHRVCFCAEEGSEEKEKEEEESEDEDEDDSSDEDDGPKPTHPPTHAQRACGIIPTPQPKSWVEYDRGLGVPGPGAGAPPLAQGGPPPAPPPPPAPVQTAPTPQLNPPNQPNLALSNLAQLNPETHPSAFSFSPTKTQFPDKIDMGMCNAWFPGGQGGVGWVERGERSLGYNHGVGASAGITRPNTNTTANTATTASSKVKLQPRDEIVFGVDFTAPLPERYAGAGVNVRGGCVSTAYGPVAASASSRSRSRSRAAGPGTSGAGSGGTNTGVEERRNGFVYETWNPWKLSSHDLLHLFSDPDVELQPSLPMSSSSAPASASNTSSTSTSTSSNTPAPPSSNSNQNQNLNSLTSHLKHTFKPGATCAQCDTRSRALREQRRSEEAEARRVLDGVMRRFRAGVGVGVGLSKPELESKAKSEAAVAAAAMSAEMSEEEGMNVDEPEPEPDRVDVDVDVGMQDLDMDGFGDEVGRVVGDALISSMSASMTFDAEEDDNDEEEEEEEEEEDYYEVEELEEDLEDLEEMEASDDDDDDAHTHTHKPKSKSRHTSTRTRTHSAYAYGVDKYGRMEVLGDDLPHGEPGFYRIQKIKRGSPSSSSPTSASVSAAVHDADAGADAGVHVAGAQQAQPQGHPQPQTEKRTHIPATRREYDRSRIGVPCTGVKDVVITGETGRRHRGWQDYRCYGRVRMWDGLVGILRFSRRSETNAIFIFGYVVGDNNFVGEWRVAASDPLRPVWGSAFVMSKRRDAVPSEAD